MASFCLMCLTQQEEIKATMHCVTCDKFLCEKDSSIHKSQHPEHDLQRHLQIDYYRLASMLELMQKLKSKMYRSLEDLENEVLRATEHFQEILRLANENIGIHIKYIENLEKELYEKGFISNDCKSKFDMYLQNDGLLGDEQVIENTFHLNLNFHLLEKIYPCLVEMRFDLKHFTEIPGDPVKVVPEFLYRGSQTGTLTKYKKIHQDLEEKKSLLDKSLANIVALKKMHNPLSINETIAKMISTIDSYDYRMSIKSLSITSQICEKKEWCLCLNKLSEVLLNVKEVTFIRLKKKQLAEILPSLLNFMKLRRVRIQGCQNFNKSSYHSIGAVLKQRKQLKEIDLSGCMSGVLGIEEVISKIASKNLLSLNLYKNIIGSSGAEVLSGVLLNFSMLRVLNLRDNDLGVAGVRFLQSPLSKLLFLEVLDISENHLKCQGLELLFQGIYRLPYLAFLDINSNSTTEEFEEQESSFPLSTSEIFEEYLPKMGSLQNLVLEMTVSNQIIGKIRKCVARHCKLFRGNLLQRTIIK